MAAILWASHRVLESPNAHSTRGHDEKSVKRRLMRIEETLKCGYLRPRRSVQWEAEENDADVGEGTPKDEFAKILIVGDQHAPLGMGNRKHLVVGQPRRIITGDTSHVMVLAREKRRNSRLAAFIEKKPHLLNQSATGAASRVPGTSVLA